ncbi:unnamed protein product [Aphanomyces euteiches]|nr:hypothetical protein AeRB84_014429 [Aphanomyces euteiches]
MERIDGRLSTAAGVVRLVLEKSTESGRAHAVADEAVALRDMATVLGSHFKMPFVSKSVAEAGWDFGWLIRFALDNKTTLSQWTQVHYALLTV